jgi:hypothetical protein
VHSRHAEATLSTGALSAENAETKFMIVQRAACHMGQVAGAALRLVVLMRAGAVALQHMLLCVL